MTEKNPIKDALLGVAIGDALGVPVEFVSRSMRVVKPVQGMLERGTHNQLSGTWSDDTSLTLCLAEMLCEAYNLYTLAGYFINWKEHGYNTARGYVFDIGIATSIAIHELSKGIHPALAGGSDEYSNGNGSLMRILPLVFYTKDRRIEDRFAIAQEVSSLTHRHIRSVIACFIYLEYARLILLGMNKYLAYKTMQTTVTGFLQQNEICPQHEYERFHRILDLKIGNYDVMSLEHRKVDEIDTTGYVVSTLEASLWCILHSNDFSEAVLKAVNLGDDTDTTGAVTGGLAGLIYGAQQIPEQWLQVLAKRREIEALAMRLSAHLKL